MNDRTGHLMVCEHGQSLVDPSCSQCGLEGKRELRAAPAPLSKEQRCNWVEDSDGAWATACGHMFELNEGAPEGNGMKFCCYCGKQLASFGYKEPEDDEPDLCEHAVPIEDYCASCEYEEEGGEW